MAAGSSAAAPLFPSLKRGLVREGSGLQTGPQGSRTRRLAPLLREWSTTCLKAALDYRRGPQEAFRVTAMLPLGRKTAEISQWRPTMRHWINLPMANSQGFLGDVLTRC